MPTATWAISVPSNAPEIVHNYYTMADVTSPVWRPKYPVGVPPPPFSADDLMPYTRPGDSAVVGRPFVGVRGKTLPCGDHDTVVLLPLTTYTSWYELWFLRQMESPDANETTLDDLAYNPKGPALLDFLSRPSAVRVADCANGAFAIPNVPTGKYELFEFVAYDSGPHDWLDGESHGYLVPGAYISQNSTWLRNYDHTKNDGFVVTAGPFTVVKNETIRVESIAWYTTHHYKVDPVRQRLSEEGYRRTYGSGK